VTKNMIVIASAIFAFLMLALSPLFLIGAIWLLISGSLPF